MYWEDRAPGVLPPKTLPVPIAPLSAPTLQLKRRQAVENRTVFMFDALDCRHHRELSSVPVAEACKTRATPHEVLGTHSAILLQKVASRFYSIYSVETC